MKALLNKALFQGYATMDMQITDVAICIITTTLIALFIYALYKRITKNSFYNKNFNISLVVLAIITAAIILTIQTNIVVSLGMVGALSIVRFRTAIKDPMDLVFLFWSISVGIICGAGFALIAVAASIVITVIIMILAGARDPRSSQILIVNVSTQDAEDAVTSVIKEGTDYYYIKSRNMTVGHTDYAIEVRTKKPAELLKNLMDMEEVTAASLLTHDGEVTV